MLLPDMTIESIFKNTNHDYTHFNPLSPSNDQHQISPCNVDVYSITEVTRIKDMITQSEFS